MYTNYYFLMMKKNYLNGITCPKEYVLALNDTLNAVSGKWKLAIVSTLFFEAKRFSDIRRIIPSITPRMISKELKELEINGIITRTVYDTTPVLVEYELTPSGRKLNEVIDKMIEWGLLHREVTLAERA
jgi:DNA-binding HxlR family transcriptional regulator